MLSDYYEALEIKKNADKNQINEAFRKMSLKWHPDNKNNTDKKVAYNKFCEVCEAFEVLSDAQRKGIYDQYGVFKLKNGFEKQKGMLIGGYEFQGNPDDIFEQFFGTNKFYAALVQFENEFANYLNEQNDFSRQPPQNIQVEKDITLLDLYQERLLILMVQLLYRNKLLKIQLFLEVMMFKKKFVFQKKEMNYQDLKIVSQKANLIVTLKQIKDDRFERKQRDIFYVHKITLLDALLSRPFQIQSIDNREILIPVSDVINPKSVIKIEGEGMCYEGRDMKNGDLYITFDIEFPKYLSLENKQTLKKILNQMNFINLNLNKFFKNNVQ